MNSSTPIDVLIAGGGLAGLTLGLQLRRDFPALHVVVVERTTRPLPEGCHKVGESSVELGSNYLESLGLREYLAEKHIFKHGLRFYPGGGKLPLEQRTEIGPAHEPIVPSYQLDRGVFESDLRGFLEERGGTVIEGATVEDVVLNKGEAPHSATIRSGEGEQEVEARWIVDATGRNALLRKQLGLTRGTKHAASAGWYRVEGHIDVNDMVPAPEEADDAEAARAWHEAGFRGDRWRSTNHMMGTGYWVWLIPLGTGLTSVGLVVHDAEHGFQAVRSLEHMQSFLEEHEPALAQHLAQYPALDYLAIRGYSHGVGRAWSADRWAMVGEAGAFPDPLYSPGTDFIAFANLFTGECIRADIEGGDLAARAMELNIQYRALLGGTIDIYRDAAPVYGHARAMISKIYWDNYAYWCFPCQYYMRQIYRLSGAEHAAFNEPGQRFVQLSNYVQSLMRAWALASPEEPAAGFRGMPAFPSVLVDTHLALRNEMSPEETLTYMKERAIEGEVIVAELLVRTLFDVGNETAQSIAEELGIERWRLRVPQERIEVEAKVGLARRHALSRMSRDVERTCGRARSESDVRFIRTLLAPLLVEGNGEADVMPVTPTDEVLAQVANVVPVG